MRRFDGTRLVIATHNPGKLVEFQTLLGPFVKEIVSAGDLHLPEPKETGTTFLENATIKALSAAKASKEICLADDTGLCVSALNDQPGVYTARWGGPGTDMTKGMERINCELGASKNRAAHFSCTLVLAWPDGHLEHVKGRVDGTICWPPRGDQGHGYDPVFVPEGDTRSFAEMTQAEKNAVSHRGRAFRNLVDQFFA